MEKGVRLKKKGEAKLGKQANRGEEHQIPKKRV